MTIGAAATPLLILTIDRLPAWLLPPWGCTWAAMPTLTSLSARGIILDRCLATTDEATATLAAIGGQAAPTGPRSWPLLAAAIEAGLAPVVVTDDARLADWTDAGPAGPMVIHVPIKPGPVAAADEVVTNLGQLFSAAADRLASGSHRLVWCHATSLGQVWDAPTEYRDAYLDPDDPPPPDGSGVPDFLVDGTTDPDLIVAVRHVLTGQLALLDHCLGWLVGAIPQASANWGILVAGVRGMGLGLHGRVGPGPMPPFGELIHLPIIFVAPDGRMAAQRFSGLVTPADLGATLLDMAGQPIASSPDPRCGRSLMSLFHDWSWPSRDRVLCPATGGVAVATPAWLLVAPSAEQAAFGTSRLYSKPDDFFELSDVADRCPAVVEELTALGTAEPDEAWTRPLSPAAVRGV